MPTPVGVPLPTQHPARHLLRGTTRCSPWSISRYQGVPRGDAAPGASPAGGTGLSMGKTSPRLHPSGQVAAMVGAGNLFQWSWGHGGSANPGRVSRGSRGSRLPVPCVVADLLSGLAAALLMGFLAAAPWGGSIIILGVGRQRLGWENRSGSGAGLCTHTGRGDSPARPGPVGCTQPHGPLWHPPSGVLGMGDGWLMVPPRPCCPPSLPTLNGSCSDLAVLRFLYPLQHPPWWWDSPVPLCHGPPSP